MDALAIIRHFYPEDTPLRRLLLKHSTQVRDRALEILALPANAALGLDRDIVANGALLHDIGIFRCHAPGILCEGTEPYIMHGIIGAGLLRAFSAELEPYARICERHTGSGITLDEIRTQKLPLPQQDFLPESLEEKLICLADKFFSKSGDMEEKPLEAIRKGAFRFGQDSLERFDEMYRMFHLADMETSARH